MSRNNGNTTIYEDGRGGKVYQIDRGDHLDAVAVPATFRAKLGVTAPGLSDADKNLLSELGTALPDVAGNLRVLKIGRDYGESAGRWLRLEDVVAYLNQAAMVAVNDDTAAAITSLARGILRAVGKET